MWAPRRLTTLWAFTACYRDSFIFLLSHYLSGGTEEDKESLSQENPELTAASLKYETRALTQHWASAVVLKLWSADHWWSVARS
jgi:hypothetical protein